MVDEVSDEALEAAALVTVGGFPTLPHTYCFGCPAIWREAELHLSLDPHEGCGVDWNPNMVDVFGNELKFT